MKHILITFFLLLTTVGFSQDSVKSFINVSAEVYSFPSTDSLTKIKLIKFTDVIVTDAIDRFYKIADVGYVRKYKVYKNDDILLYEKGMDKKEREQFKKEKQLAIETERREKQLADEQREKERQLAIEKKRLEREKRLINKYGSKIGKKISNGTIWLGMTKEMTRESWGNPIDINRTVSASGVFEQWVYPDDNYIYFEDGILTSWQD